MKRISILLFSILCYVAANAQTNGTFNNIRLRTATAADTTTNAVNGQLYFNHNTQQLRLRANNVWGPVGSGGGGGGGLSTASNGLTTTGADVALGGTLTNNTTIDGDGDTYSISFSDLNGFNVTSPADNIVLSGGSLGVNLATATIGGGQFYVEAEDVVLFNSENGTSFAGNGQVDFANKVDFDGGTNFLAPYTEGGGAEGDFYYNTTTNKFRANQGGSWVDVIGGGGSVTASNGLTLSGSDVQLGGTLSSNTTVSGGGTRSMTFTNLTDFTAAVGTTSAILTANELTFSTAFGAVVIEDDGVSTSKILTSADIGLQVSPSQTNNTGTGPSLSIMGGAANVGNNNGGSVTISSGSGFGTGTSGAVTIYANTGPLALIGNTIGIGASYASGTVGNISIQGNNSPTSAGAVSITGGQSGGASINGANVIIAGGDAGAGGGNANGGNLIMSAGAKSGSGTNGNVIINNLPTSSPGVSNSIWVDQGTLVNTSTGNINALISSSTSTAGGTVTLNMNSHTQAIFVGSATFATSKTMALSNSTNALCFNFHFEVTNVAATLVFPSTWLMSDVNFDTGTDTWTPPSIGKYELGGSFDGTNWKIKISGPFN